MSKFLNYKNVLTKVEVKEEINIENIEELKKFLEALEGDIEELYKEAKLTNDLSVITKFSKALLELSLKHNINYMIGYSELLLEKIDSFEIDSIGVMLNDYEYRIETLTITQKALSNKFN